jgi:hypothetical protein
VTFPSKFQFSVIFGTGFEVLTVLRICSVVWVRTPYSLVHTWLWMFWRRILCLSLHRPLDEGSSRSRPNLPCWPFTLHDPITEKTTISNLNIMYFSCIVSICYKKTSITHVGQYIALLFYIILWCEQYCVAGNIKKNSTVYCLISACSCFVVIWSFIYLVPLLVAVEMPGNGIAGSYFTDVLLHSSINYHKERATEARRSRLGRCNFTFPRSFQSSNLCSDPMYNHCMVECSRRLGMFLLCL